MIWAFFKWTCLVIGAGWVLATVGGVLLAIVFFFNLVTDCDPSDIQGPINANK